MAVNYGQVAIVPKGVWNAETQYKVNNLVEYDGSSYVAKVQPPVGTLPTDTSYWQVSAAGTKKATADSLGTVMPDGTTTEIKEDGKLSAKTAQQNALGVVKGSDDIIVGEDGNLTVNTTFEQATELANIIAGEAIKSVLGKVSKAIATTMSLDENALLKNMISGIDVNDSNKVPSSAYIHTLVERIGMGTELVSGLGDLTTGLNTVNNNLGNGVFKALTFSDFSTSDDIKLACQKMFSALPTSGVCYRVRMKPTPSGTTADAYVYCASSNYGFVHIRDHGGTDYYGRVQNGTWTWDSYALKSALDSRASCDSWVTDLDSAPKAIILRTNTDPTGYPTNLGGNSCLAFQLNPGTKYSAQLAFSFSKDRLAIRRKNNSDTWTAWKYVDFTIS